MAGFWKAARLRIYRVLLLGVEYVVWSITMTEAALHDVSCFFPEPARQYSDDSQAGEEVRLPAALGRHGERGPLEPPGRGGRLL